MFSIDIIVDRNSSLSEQEGLMELMWLLWQELPLYGRKAAQFVDLLGYFVLKTPQTSEKKVKYSRFLLGMLGEGQN